ncbi:hypothetical protein JCM10556A_24640 [Bacteroides acidifaciens]
MHMFDFKGKLRGMKEWIKRVNDNGLNVFLNVIFCIMIAVGITAICMGLFNILGGIKVNIYLFLGCVCAACIDILGFYWMLKAKKEGFYLFIIACVLCGTLLYLQRYGFSLDGFDVPYFSTSNVFSYMVASLGRIIIFMLLMLLRRNGKNAYQVMWGKK